MYFELDTLIKIFKIKMSQLKSNYKISKNHKLVIEFHFGILEIKPFIKFIKNKTSDPLFSLDLNHLIDLRNVTFNTTVNDIHKSVKFLASKLLTQGSKRNIAILTSTPSQVVSTTLYKIKQQEQNSLIKLEIFSTPEKALKWLNYNSTSSVKVINTLEELKNNL